MRELEEREEERHAIALLLPWYLTGTLTDEERQQVDQHLAECGACRRELEELSQLRVEVQAAHAAQPGLAPDLFARVLARIKLAEAAKGRVQQAPAPTGLRWWDQVEAWLRTLFTPRWAPVLATSLIVIQLVTIAGLVGVLYREQQERFGTLTGPTIEQSGPVALLRVTFQERAPEGEVRALLQEIGGRIVDGPSTAGFYLVAVPAAEPADLEKVITTLRARPDLIRFTERIEP